MESKIVQHNTYNMENYRAPIVQQSCSTVHRTSTRGAPVYGFYSSPSSFGEGSPQRPKSCPSCKPNIGRYELEHQLESVTTSMPNGNIKRELQDELKSLVSENARLCGWQFGATPYFGAKYPCPTMSFISRRYLHDFKSSSSPCADPKATRLKQPDIFLGKPKGLSGEGTRTTIGLSANTQLVRGRLSTDNEPLSNLPEPKPEQRPQGQRQALKSVTMALDPAKKGPEYWERRRRNNQSARKFRDARKIREIQMQRKLVYIEGENVRLRREIYASQVENFRLKEILSANCDVCSTQESQKQKFVSNERLSTGPSFHS